MSRRRKINEQDGDRSHIPREERSYVEYHPRLLVHLALTLVRQPSDHNRRASSRIDRDQLPRPTNGKSSNTNGIAPYGDTSRRTSTTNSSLLSHDAAESQRDDLYALGQIITPESVEPVSNGDTFERPGNLFADESGSTSHEHGNGSSKTADFAIDPALLADYDEIATPMSGQGAFTPSRSSTRKSSLNGQSTLANGSNGINGHLSPNGQPGPQRSGPAGSSDRFLRSEVSVEEKYERLRREEGFAIGKLHEPTFRRIDDSVMHHKVKLTSNAIAFGYQADRPYEAAKDSYTRTTEVPETELTDRVEYDMDEQDDYWLTQYNQVRATRDGDSISREIFEITLTKIEKEWTALEKRIPKPEKKEEAPSEDAKCAICDDGECENTNAIVFCDGCNLAVHQACYGVPYIPEGQWLCRKCFASPVDPVSCVFCPSKQGAFKQTSDLHWAHLLCTNWIPEVNVGNLVFMEPIEGVANIPTSRWKLVCYICKLRLGACIQCSNKSCYTPFHVSCARQAKLFLQRDPMNPNALPKSFCDKHVPDWYREVVDVKSSLRKAQDFFTVRTDPRAQAYVGEETTPSRGQFVVSLKRSRPNAVIPAIVFGEILLYMQKFRIRNKADFIADLCKYWSLKRRSRRGVSLLKRLQIQIEDNASQKTDSKQRYERLQFSKLLLKELDDHHRPILDELMERETLKQELSVMRDSVIEHLYLPLQGILHQATNAVKDIDAQKLLEQISMNNQHERGFLQALSWRDILHKIEEAQYMDFAAFEADFKAMQHNILLAFPETSTKERRLINRLDDRLRDTFARCRLAERALVVHDTNKIATAFDQDFEPKGLELLEEKPFNWALRDASPLSDLDDDTVAQLETPGFDLKTLSPSVQKSSQARHAGRNLQIHVPKEIPEPISTTSLPVDEIVKACSSCKGRKIRCDGSDRACHKHPEHAEFLLEQDDEDEIASPLKATPLRRLSLELLESPVLSQDKKANARPGRTAKSVAQENLSKSADRRISLNGDGPLKAVSDTPRRSRSALKEQISDTSLKRKRDESEAVDSKDSPSAAVRSRRRKL